MSCADGTRLSVEFYLGGNVGTLRTLIGDAARVLQPPRRLLSLRPIYASSARGPEGIFGVESE